jgi:CRISPR-associated protein Cmr6
MNNGTVGRIRKNEKSGALYTFIKDDGNGSEIYYKLGSADERKLTEGVKVTYDTRTGQAGADRPEAYNVRLHGGKAPEMPQNRTHSWPDARRSEVRANDSAYYLPKDTSRLLFSSAGVTIENTALKTQKYLQNTKDSKTNLKVLSGHDYSKAEVNLLASVRKESMNVLGEFKYAFAMTGTLGSRMVIGLGGVSAYETSITLHHTYGVPYIPGSTVKGSLRSYIIRELFSGSENDASADECFIKVFGTQKQRGGVVFMDAFPEKCDKLEADIMNPHYSDYYQGKSAPTDDSEPTPIKFYAVPSGTGFTFLLAGIRVKDEYLDVNRFTVKGIQLTELLKVTLSEMGIGAKTAIGYGWFGYLRELEL